MKIGLEIIIMYVTKVKNNIKLIQCYSNSYNNYYREYTFTQFGGPCTLWSMRQF